MHFAFFFSSFFHRVFSQICKNDKNVFFPLNMHDFLPLNDVCTYIAPERHCGDVPWRPPFHTSFVVRKGPISSKRVSSQDPLLRKFWNLTLYTASIFAQTLALKPPNLEIFSSQAPKFGNFQFTSPLFQSQISVRKPHTSEIRAAPAHTLPEKSWVPPRDIAWFSKQHNYVIYFYKDDIQLQIQLPPCWCGLPSVIKVEHGNENNSSY